MPNITSGLAAAPGSDAASSTLVNSCLAQPASLEASLRRAHRNRPALTDRLAGTSRQLHQPHEGLNPFWRERGLRPAGERSLALRRAPLAPCQPASCRTGEQTSRCRQSRTGGQLRRCSQLMVKMFAGLAEFAEDRKPHVFQHGQAERVSAQPAPRRQTQGGRRRSSIV